MKGFTVALCIDTNGGMLFNRRRQSRDRVLLADLCRTANSPIYISSFSSALFPENGNIKTIDDPFAAPPGSFIFVEDRSLIHHTENINCLILYKWNRSYPRDMVLDIDPIEQGFKLTESYDFVGSSHDKITKEIYIK